MTTELEAVNTMLMVIGQPPVRSVIEGGISDSSQALSVLKEMTNELQSAGYDFNTDREVEYTPRVTDNRIPIPDGIARMDSPNHETRRVTFRRGFLYDRTNKTFEFTTPIKLDTMFLEDFEFLPQALQRYVVIRAARVFANRVVGAREINGYTQEDEARAKSEWLNQVSEDEDLNIFTTSEGNLSYLYSPVTAIR